MNKKNSYRRILINIFKLVYAASNRSILRNKCHAQCGEGEGDCDEDNNFLKIFASGNATNFLNGSRKHTKSMELIFAKLNGMMCSLALSRIVTMEFYRP